MGVDRVHPCRDPDYSSGDALNRSAGHSLSRTIRRWRRSLKRTLSSLASMSGRCRKAVAGGVGTYTMTAIGTWYQSGVFSPIARRGLVMGLVTTIIIYYVPNDDTVQVPDDSDSPPLMSSDPISSPTEHGIV